MSVINPESLLCDSRGVTGYVRLGIRISPQRNRESNWTDGLRCSFLRMVE